MHVPHPSTRLGAPLGIALCILSTSAGCRAVGPPADRPSPAQEPGELVDVGYGTAEAKNLTGAVSSITAAELAQATSMERMLRGRVPGLQILRRSRGDVLLSIRGSGRGAGPYVVIDGAPSTAANLLAMSPEVVARIDVLKDASAAVFGLRGANGVILVTTKRGR